MASKSDYLENKVLDHCLGVAAFTHAADVYIALFTVAPTDSTAGTEVSGGSYTREICAFDAASAGASANTSLVTFTTATADWGDIVGLGIMDAGGSSGGNLHYYTTVTLQTINNGDTATIVAGAIDVTED